jgi:hypothetical protein
MDGFSFALVARRVAEVYTALTAEAIAGPHKFGSLARLLEDEADYRASKRFADDRRYWMDHLAGLPEPASFSERARLKSQGFVRHTGAVPFPTISRLGSIGERTGASLPQLATAAAAIFVHRLTGAQDAVLDVPVTARMTPLARSTPSMLANALPVRLAVRWTWRCRCWSAKPRGGCERVSPPALQHREPAAGHRTA